MISEEQYAFIADSCEDMDLNGLWTYFSEPFWKEFLPLDLESFESRREAFLWVLQRLQDEKRIVIVDLESHKPIPGTSLEIVEEFRNAFPINEKDMDMGLWFFSKECPGGSNWKYQ